MNASSSLFDPCPAILRRARRRTARRRTARRLVVAGVAAVVFPLFCPAATRAESADEPVDRRPQVSVADVPQLLRELGDDRYAVRKRAEEQLIQLGPVAFDQLKQAEDSVDLEVAARVQHILFSLRVAWTRPDDAPEVRSLLSNYDEMPLKERQARIEQLDQLPEFKGRAALCRIARYEPSSISARIAALRAVSALGRTGLPPIRPTPSVCQAMANEIDGSESPPTRWIAAYLAETSDPQRASTLWQKSVDDELALMRSGSTRTIRFFVERVMRCQLEWLAGSEEKDALRDALGRWIELEGPSSAPVDLNAGLEKAVVWTLERQQWEALEGLRERYAEPFARNRFLAYATAVSAHRQGRTADAQALAERSFELELDDLELRAGIAERLVRLGLADWGFREFRQAIERLPLASYQGMLARNEMAMWLHDREQYREAAEIMTALTDAVDEDAAIRAKLFEDLQKVGDSQEKILAFRARRYFYEACWREAEGDAGMQLAALQAAVKEYEEDADVLIALYRYPDEAVRAQTLGRIRKISVQWLKQIEEFPDAPYLYNQWAWLIANTEGDFDKAVKFSQKSLELQPEEASYLDTLGRCYYAAGDLEQAVETQRRAVVMRPDMQVMQRQLQLFENELVRKKQP